MILIAALDDYVKDGLDSLRLGFQASGWKGPDPVRRRSSPSAIDNRPLASRSC